MSHVDMDSPLGLEMLMNPHKLQPQTHQPAQPIDLSTIIAADDKDSVYAASEEPKIRVDRAEDERVDFRQDYPRAYSQSVLSHESDVREYATYAEPKRESAEDIINLKRELLYKFNRLEKKGVLLPKKFTMNSTYEEMKLEYDRVCHDRDVDNSVLLQRRILMTAISTLEFANNKLDPFDLKLDGWSESVSDKLNEYDDVFEELYEKYKGKGSMPPEAKLLMMVSGSAFMFHMTQTMFGAAAPTAKQVFAENPDLQRQFAAATASTMKQQSPAAGMFGNMFGSMFGSSQPAPASNPPPPMNRARMSGPGDLSDVFAMADVDNLSMKSEPPVEAPIVEITSDVESDTSDKTKFPDNESILVTGGRGRGRPRKNSSNPDQVRV